MKIKKSDLLNMIQEQNDVIAKLIRQVNCHHKDIIRIEGVIEPEPQAKQLDQSVFNNMHERWKFVAVDQNAETNLFEEKPVISSCGNYWVNASGAFKRSVLHFDNSNWQNSLIERDIAKELLEVDLSSELTGSGLCRAMLARGDKCVLIRMGVRDDKQAKDIGRFAIAISIDESGRFNVMSDQQPITKVSFAVPINNQGEPLTASEAGL